MSGQTVFDGLSVDLAGATPPDTRYLKSQLPEVLVGCFLWIPRAPFKRKQVCSFDSRGLKWQYNPKSHFRDIPFFRIGTYQDRQAVVIGSDIRNTDRDLT